MTKGVSSRKRLSEDGVSMDGRVTGEDRRGRLWANGIVGVKARFKAGPGCHRDRSGRERPMACEPSGLHIGPSDSGALPFAVGFEGTATRRSREPTATPKRCSASFGDRCRGTAARSRVLGAVSRRPCGHGWKVKAGLRRRSGEATYCFWMRPSLSKALRLTRILNKCARGRSPTDRYAGPQGSAALVQGRLFQLPACRPSVLWLACFVIAPGG